MTKTITGNFKNTINSNLVPTTGAGLTLQLTLTAPATANGVAQIAPTMVNFNLTNSTINANTVIWANDELTPNTLFYQAQIVDIANNIIWGPVRLNISGTSPIDLTTLTPVF